MKPISTSIYSFESLREGKYLYVDKTMYLWELVKEPVGIFFCSRPRRFGKSLTVSALKAIFEGKRHLFEGLYIDQMPYDWKTYPIIHIDLGSSNVVDGNDLENYLQITLKSVAKDYGIEPIEAKAGYLFNYIVETLGKTEKVVLLIDEYDKPLIDNIDSAEIEGIRHVMDGFYSVIKSTNAWQRFVFMTGVTKFSTSSASSKLNNLRDITMEAKFATMFGYTQEELELNFGAVIAKFAQEQGVSEAYFTQQMKLHYNGYRFEENANTVYNPVSIGKFIENNGEFLNFWFATGNPSFLIKLSKTMEMDVVEMLEHEVTALSFDSFEVTQISLLPLLVQTGYLTIVSSRIVYGQPMYRLGFPNREVEQSFGTYLVSGFVNKDRDRIGSDIFRLSTMFDNGQTAEAMTLLQSFCAEIPYDWQIKKEGYFNTIFYTIFRILGLNLRGEVHTNRGRIDTIVEGINDVYIIEFKLNQTADAAIAQIREKGYHEAFAGSAKTIHLIGINFGSAERNIVEWKEEIVGGEQ